MQTTLCSTSSTMSFPNPCNFLRFFKWVNPASRGYIFAVWASGVRKVASADNRSSFYRACARLVTWFASKIIVIPFVKVREFRGNQTCKQLCSRFCFVLALFSNHFAPSFQWFYRTDFLKSSFPRKVYANNCIKASLLCGEHITPNGRGKCYRLVDLYIKSRKNVLKSFRSITDKRLFHRRVFTKFSFKKTVVGWLFKK